MSEPTSDTVTLTPSTRRRRRNTIRMVSLFVLLGLPVALILGLLLTPALAAGYLVAQTAFLTFGLQRRHQPILRFSAAGVAFEGGQFVLKSAWDNVDCVGSTDLPSGTLDALLLREPSLYWAADAATRATVARRGWDRVVPIGEFEDDWRSGQIGTALRRWAPHLL